MRFGARILFEDVTCTFLAGRRYAITGPNGAGKSTLMKILAGDLEPSKGTVTRPKKFGVLRNFDRCAFLTVSTGTGAAIQLGKASTSLTSSIEIGHQVLDGNALKCLCGQVGCLETFTGGRQLELRSGRSMTHMTDSAFWETFSDKLAMGLVNLAQLTRIDAVAIGGAIALNNSLLLPMLQRKVNTILRGAILELKLAALGANAPMVGAAMLLDAPEDAILH